MVIEPVDDEVLRRATGLSRDTVRRLVVDRLMTPLETPRGRGIRRQWSIGDFRRASLIAAFLQVGASASWATPIVHEFVDELLEDVAREKHGPGLIAVYHSIYAFLEYPEGDMAVLHPPGDDMGWRACRLLCAFLSKDELKWIGYPGGIIYRIRLYRDQPMGTWQRSAPEERSYYDRLFEIGEYAHALAEEFECAILVHASRAIRSAEARAEEIQQTERAP